MSDRKYLPILSTLILCVCLVLPLTVHAKPAVTGYSFDSKDSQTIIQFSLSDVAEYKTFTLQKPDRLVIDIPNADWKLLGDQKGDATGLVKKVRYGTPSETLLRIVLDLSSNIKIENSTFILPKEAASPHLLVIAMRKSSGAVAKTDKKLPASMQYEYKSKLPFKVPTYKPESVIVEHAPKPDKRPWKRYKPIVILDPGHGGIDPGAIGKSGLEEKNITLQYAKTLKHALESTGRYRVVLTRSSDKFVKLSDRVKKARKMKGDLMISLHADSHPDSKTRGLSVYTLSEKRAEREKAKLLRNADSQEVISGVNLKHQSDDVQHMLIDMAQQQTKNTSASFAELLVQELGDDARLLRNTHRHAGFVVLTGADVPSVLVELGYLSNPSEEKLLRKASHRKRLVWGIRDAIDRYFWSQKTR